VSRAPARPARAVQVGLVLFGIGVLALLADVIPFFFGATDRPLWLNLACLLVPVGLVVAVWAALARGRREQKAALREVQRPRQG
jgi:uncharacterized membrane protein YhdT